MEITDPEQVKAVGRILHNNTKLRMLLTLAISPLPKREISARMNIPWSTVWAYLQELKGAGLTEEYFFVDGSATMVMVRLKERKVVIDLNKVKMNEPEPAERLDT